MKGRTILLSVVAAGALGGAWGRWGREEEAARIRELEESMRREIRDLRIRLQKQDVALTALRRPSLSSLSDVTVPSAEPGHAVAPESPPQTPVRDTAGMLQPSSPSLPPTGGAPSLPAGAAEEVRKIAQQEVHQLRMQLWTSQMEESIADRYRKAYEQAVADPLLNLNDVQKGELRKAWADARARETAFFRVASGLKLDDPLQRSEALMKFREEQRKMEEFRTQFQNRMSTFLTWDQRDKVTALLKGRN